MLKLVGFFNFWKRSITSANHFILFIFLLSFFSLVTLSLHFCFGLGFSSGKLVSVVAHRQSSLVGSHRRRSVLVVGDDIQWNRLCRGSFVVGLYSSSSTFKVQTLSWIAIYWFPVLLQCLCSFRLCSSLNNVVQCLRLGSSVSNYWAFLSLWLSKNSKW